MVHKRMIVLALLVLLPALAGCQPAGEARAQFCAGLRGLAPAVTQLVEGKDVASAGQLKQKLVLFRDALSLVVSQASQIPNLDLDNLIQSLDAYETQVRALPDEMPIQQVNANVSAAAGKFKGEYEAISGAVCATS
jgi:hypothetical protein